MTSAKGGRSRKDQGLVDGFNPQGSPMTARQILEAKRAAKMQKIRDEQERIKKMEEVAKLKIKKIKEGISVAEMEMVKAIDAIPEPEPQPAPIENIDGDDEKSAHRMLADMRWVYRKVHGRRKLKELVESDDKQFVSMVKELMKIESALMTANIRKDGDVAVGGGTGQQNFFVVLKGLEDDTKMVSAVLDKTVDMKQITRAMNPDENSYEPEEAVDKDAAPEMLLKPGEERVE